MRSLLITLLLATGGAACGSAGGAGPARSNAPCGSDDDCRLDWVAPCDCVAVLRSAPHDPRPVPTCVIHPCSGQGAFCDAATHACVARSAEVEPDPITRPLDEMDARREAARLANLAYERDRALAAHGPAPFSAESMIGGLEGDSWRLRDEPPAGPWARVSFGRWADHPTVEVGFASQ